MSDRTNTTLTLHLVSHTHWDREWYLTFEEFRLRLVDLIDHVIDILDSDPQFQHFSLDAQTIVLEDYLEVRPHRRADLERLIRCGRLGVGPWYQLNDSYLVSGESTIRSLLIGSRIARGYGACLAIGYLPDQFGNISQMPQIFRGFGIDNAIVGRGRRITGDRTLEFHWESPDGSRVIASLMAYWYNNAQYLPPDSAAAGAFITELAQRMASRSALNHLLLMNGVDHLEAQPYAGRVTAEVDAAFKASGAGMNIVHSTLEAYVEGLREASADPAIETVRGELREDHAGSCLAGVLSTRTYLKQANAAAQIALEGRAERLAAFAAIDGAPYPTDELRYAWKLLMQNHPHDSICGCSIDQVHREMMPRFERVGQVCAVLESRALDALTGRDRTLGAIAPPCDLLVWNTLNWARTDPVVVTLAFPLGSPARGNAVQEQERILRGIRILSDDGSEVPFGVRSNEIVLDTVLNPHELPLDQWVQQMDIEFAAHNVPPCGYARYRVEAAGRMPEATDGAWPHPLPEDTFLMEDMGEVGDEYLHRAPLRDSRIRQTIDLQRDIAVESTAVRRSVVADAALQIPETSSPAARSARLVSLPVQIQRTEWADVARWEYDIVVDNRARDHRLRALFDCAGPPTAGAPFDAITRPRDAAAIAAGAAPTSPMTLWVDAPYRDAEGGVTLVCPGLYELEYIEGANEAGSAVAITLLRCVGQLSGRGDGPGMPTPDAQCPGAHHFRLAVVRHCAGWQESLAWRQAHQFESPLIGVQVPSVPEAPERRSYLMINDTRLVLSAIKRAEDRDTVIVRFYNTTDEPARHVEVSLPGAERWRAVNLNEEPLEAWNSGDAARVDVRGKQIMTLEFELSRALLLPINPHKGA